MATIEVLTTGEVKARYGIGAHLISIYIDAGLLPAYRAKGSGGDGGSRFQIPADAAEKVLGAYRDAVTPEIALREFGIERGAIRTAMDSGKLVPIPNPDKASGKAVRAGVYFKRSEFLRWLEARKARRTEPEPTKASTNGTHAPEPTPIQMPLAPASPASTTVRVGEIEVTRPDPALLNEVKALRGDIQGLRFAIDGLGANVKAQADALTRLATGTETTTGKFVDQVAAMAKAIDSLATWVGLSVDPSSTKIDPAKATSLNTKRPA